ncbi:integrase, partial [Vibrio breoganii]
TLVYAKTKNIRAVQLLLGHTKVDNTIRYLGVELEDVLMFSEGIELAIRLANVQKVHIAHNATTAISLKHICPKAC